MGLSEHSVETSDFIMCLSSPVKYFCQEVTVVSPAKDKEGFIYLFIVGLFSDGINMSDYT
jgi:hypothetical protein